MWSLPRRSNPSAIRAYIRDRVNCEFGVYLTGISSSFMYHRIIASNEAWCYSIGRIKKWFWKLEDKTKMSISRYNQHTVTGFRFWKDLLDYFIRSKCICMLSMREILQRKREKHTCIHSFCSSESSRFHQFTEWPDLLSTRFFPALTDVLSLNNAVSWQLDNYEVVDQSLKPIKDALRPTFTEDMIRNLDQNQVLAQDAFGVSYLPGRSLCGIASAWSKYWLQMLGFIGLNNLKRTDYISVVVHALAHIPPLRDFFLLTSNTNITHKSSFLLRFGELLCKIWSPYNIKNTVY